MGAREDYAEAMALVEDPEVDDETKAQLRTVIGFFEKANPTLAAKVHVPETAWLGAPSGLDALDRSLNKPLSGDEYVKKKALLEGHTQEKAGLHKTRARKESVIEPITTMPEETARSIQRGLTEFEEESPEEIPAQGRRDTSGQVLFGDDGQPFVSEGAVPGIGAIDQDIDAKREQLGLIGYDEELPSASKRKDLYAPPEHVPPGLGVADLMTAGYFYEPDVEVVKAALRTRGWSQSEVEDLTKNDQAYKNFADAMWLETYERSEREGKPAIRVEYMNDDGWLGGAAKLSARALSKAAPVAGGADVSLTGGALSEGMLGLTDMATGGDTRRQLRQSMADSPYLTGAGAIMGALNPRSLASRLYSGGAGAATRMGAPGMVSSAAGAGFAGGVGSATESTVRNLGERAFASDPQLISGPQASERALSAAALSAPFGPLGELIGRSAGKLVRRTREHAEIGPKLTQAEQAGITTQVRIPLFRGAITKTPEVKAAQRAAAEAGQGKTAKQVLAEKLEGPIGEAGLEKQASVVGPIGEAKEAFFKSRVGKTPRSIDRTAGQVLDEVKAQFDDAGRPKPLTSSERKTLGKLAEEVLEVRLVPKAEARKEVAKYKGGGRRMSDDEVFDLVNRIPELETTIRQAERSALEEARKPGPVKPAKQVLTPEPVDMAGAPTERNEVAGLGGILKGMWGGKNQKTLDAWEAAGRRQLARGEITQEQFDAGMARIQAQRSGASTQRDTMLPPPTEGATMRSPSFKSPRGRSADVSVQEPLNEGRLIRAEAEGGGPAFALADIPELVDHVYIVGPRKMNARDLDGLIGRLSDKVKDLKNRKGSAPLEDRLLAAAMDDANKYPMAGQEAMQQGDKARSGFGAFRARSDVALTEMEKGLQGAGLPRRLEAMPGEVGSAPRPRLDATAEKTLRGTIENFSGSNKDLAALADAKGMGAELRRIAGLDAYQDLTKASGWRAFFGSQGNLSFYTGSPGDVLALSADPIMKGLSKAKPEAPAISKELYDFVKGLAATGAVLKEGRQLGVGGGVRDAYRIGKHVARRQKRPGSTSLDPIGDINKATSLGSARQLGPAGSAAARKERYTMADFTPAEMELFDRIVKAMKQNERQAASGE